MISFACNICGSSQTTEREQLDREAPSCAACGSNVRFRAIVHLLSLELFGESLPLPDIPRIPELRGIGMSDWLGYAGPLAQKFDYVNTFYDEEPRLDVCDVPPRHRNAYDFVIATEVFEHVPPPVQRAFEGARELLKPGGVLILTVPWVPGEGTREHYPDLHDFELDKADGKTVLVNRRRDGRVEVFEDIVFHGGPGSTLEMRLFGERDLKEGLRAAGFREVRVAGEEVLEYGIAHPILASLPIVARCEPFRVPRRWLGLLARDLAARTRQVEELSKRLEASGVPVPASLSGTPGPGRGSKGE